MLKNYFFVLKVLALAFVLSDAKRSDSKDFKNGSVATEEERCSEIGKEVCDSFDYVFLNFFFGLFLKKFCLCSLGYGYQPLNSWLPLILRLQRTKVLVKGGSGVDAAIAACICIGTINAFASG